MRSRRSYARKKPKTFHSLFLSAVIVAGGLALFWIIRSMFSGESGEMGDVQLHVPPRNTVYIQVADQDAFQPTPSELMSLLEDESLQSRNTAGAFLHFFDDSKVYLDSQSEITLESARQHEGEARDIQILLSLGRIWVETSQTLNPRSHFRIRVGEDVFLDSKNGVFSVDTDQDIVRVSRGLVRIYRSEGEELSWFEDIGINQQFSFAGNVSDNALAPLEKDEWFLDNQERGSSADTPPEDSSVDTAENEEGEDDSLPTSDEVSGIQILVPGTNGQTVSTTSDPQVISGTVPTGTAKVTVTAPGSDPYALQKFQAGNTRFEYTAATEYNNLKAGDNTYIVTAFDANDAQISSASVTLSFSASGSESGTSENTPVEEESVSSPPATEQSAPTGSLEITQPNGGSNFTAEGTQGVDLVGTAPSNAAFVEVNGYRLSQFSAGSSTWTYRIRSNFGNMQSGQNTYTVKALNASGGEISRDSITITFPEVVVATPEASSSDEAQESEVSVADSDESDTPDTPAEEESEEPETLEPVGEETIEE